MPEGFVYDTEPPARAVLSAGRLDPELGFEVFKAIQHGFYVDQIDVTQTEALAQLVTEHEIGYQDFIDLFASDEMRALVQQHFIQTRKFGVRGFPTLAIGQEENPTIITSGYQPFTSIEGKIQNWLDTQ